MKIESLAALLLVIVIGSVTAPPILCEVSYDPYGQEAAAQQNPPQGGAPETPLPATGSVETLRLLVGKSVVINSPEVLKRVSVTDDKIAYAVIISPNQVLIHALKPGSVTLILWNEREEMRSFELQAQVDLRPIRETLQRTFPGESFQIDQSGDGIILTGTASSQDVVDKATAVIKTQYPNVVNLLAVPVEPNKVVLLQVRIAEVDRNALQQLGVNIFSTGALNTIGRTTTGQFTAPIISDVNSGRNATTTTQLGDLLNIFVFRPDLNLGLTIKALEARNLLQMLAEPNLLALGGKEASFLAGGEFPVPIVQGGTGIQTVTVQFREFGVRLKFVATPAPDGTIRLHVNPEVSALDYANAVTLSGFVIPALTTRKAETEVELRDGQSFAIAGLIDKRMSQIVNKIPWIGDLPFLGNLFKSKEWKANNSELLVMVTPNIVKPLEPGQAPPVPAFPLPFLDQQKFDGGKTGQVPAKTKDPSQ
jgi:pilus assembly protein CpaC